LKDLEINIKANQKLEEMKLTKIVDRFFGGTFFDI
jgi:hypothetical protein